MFLHDVGFDKFDIACEDTLISPQHWDDEPFELIVSNPPYSIKWAGDANPLLINDPRFAPAGDEKILGLYKKVCRRYLYVYPRYIKFCIEAYREMWEDEEECLKMICRLNRG